MVYIYFLSKNDVPFYIGKTKDLIRRKHIHYKNYGTSIKIEIIDTYINNRDEWKFWEKYWIYQFKSWGFNLENKNNGGGGPTNYTNESKQKMHKPHKEGTGKKISKTLIERNHSKYYTR